MVEDVVKNEIEEAKIEQKEDAKVDETQTEEVRVEPQEKKQEEIKVEETYKEGRIYTIPLRKAYHIPMTRRAKKAIRLIKEFISRHEKVPIDQIRISNELNETVWSRGIQKPPRRVKVKTLRSETKTIVELAR